MFFTFELGESIPPGDQSMFFTLEPDESIPPGNKSPEYWVKHCNTTTRRKKRKPCSLQSYCGIYFWFSLFFRSLFNFYFYLFAHTLCLGIRCAIVWYIFGSPTVQSILLFLPKLVFATKPSRECTFVKPPNPLSHFFGLIQAQNPVSVQAKLRSPDTASTFDFLYQELFSLSSYFCCLPISFFFALGLLADVCLIAVILLIVIFLLQIVYYLIPVLGPKTPDQLAIQVNQKMYYSLTYLYKTYGKDNPKDQETLRKAMQRLKKQHPEGEAWFEYSGGKTAVNWFHFMSFIIKHEAQFSSDFMDSVRKGEPGVSKMLKNPFNKDPVASNKRPLRDPKQNNPRKKQKHDKDTDMVEEEEEAPSDRYFFPPTSTRTDLFFVFCFLT